MAGALKPLAIPCSPDYPPILPSPRATREAGR